MSVQAEISLISRMLIEECRELAWTSAFDVLHWRWQDVANRDGGSQDDLPLADVRHCQFELALFHFAIFTHLISALSPLPGNVRRQLHDETCKLFEHWAGEAFSEHLSRVLAGVPRHVRWRLAEYDAPTVVKAVTGVNSEAQETICRRLYANTQVNPGESEATSFRIEFCCQAIPRSAIRILDALYSKLGPNSPQRSIYDVDHDARTIEISSMPRIDTSKSVVRPLPDPIASQLGSRRSVARLVAGASSILIVCSITALIVAAVGLIIFTANFDIIRLAVSLAVVPAAGWLTWWALRHLATSLATLSVRRSGRYVLYLRQSEIDRASPSIDFEPHLGAAFAPIAPLTGISRGSLVRPLGIVRVRSQADWELAVTQLIQGAELSVLVVGPRRGYDQGWGNSDQAWKEIEAITHLAAPGRVLFLFPRQTGDFPLLLLHPKGDRVCGVSTLLFEVRRLIDPQFTGSWPERMGRDSWLWWTPDGRFLPLPTSARDTLSVLRHKVETDLDPLIQRFDRVRTRNWWTTGLVGAGIISGLITTLLGSSSLLREIAGQWGFAVAAALAALLVFFDFAFSLLRRSRWLSYNNTIRPLSTHPFGLQGMPEGRGHDNLPY